MLTPCFLKHEEMLTIKFFQHVLYLLMFVCHSFDGDIDFTDVMDVITGRMAGKLTDSLTVKTALEDTCRERQVIKVIMT